MKGVIVQVGDPKSIVLFNNGKIGAIPTPAGCHVGMVVTVKFNNKLKITVLVLAALLLAGAGVFTGVFIAKGSADTPPPASAIEDGEPPGWERGVQKQQKIEKKFSP
jgi:hypothetical protein